MLRRPYNPKIECDADGVFRTNDPDAPSAIDRDPSSGAERPHGPTVDDKIKSLLMSSLRDGRLPQRPAARVPAHLAKYVK